MQKIIILMVNLFAFVWITCSPQPEVVQPYATNTYVDLFMGSATHPQVFPGPVAPGGQMAVKPLTFEPSSASPSTYRYQSPYLYGFLHTFGNKNQGLLVMSVFGDEEPVTIERKSPYSFESAEPGFYRAKLDSFSTFAEMTVTPHTSLDQFRYQDGWAHIFLEPCIFGHSSTSGKLAIANPFEIEGYTTLENGQKLYFVARFNRSAMGGGFYRNNKLIEKNVDELTGKDIGVYFSFRTLEGNEVLLKVGFSYDSTEHARERLNEEQPGWAFALQRNKVRESWEQVLSNIMAYGGSEDFKTMFYTSLYRSLVSVSLAEKAPELFDSKTSAPDILKVLYSNACAADNRLLSANETGNKFDKITHYFANSPAGFPATDSLSVLSSQLALALLGLAPQCDQSDSFTISVPFFERIDLNRTDESENASPFIIQTSKKPTASSSIRSAKLSGQSLTNGISSTDIQNGDNLVIKLE